MNTHKKESLAINFAAWNDHHTELTVVLTGLTGWKYQISVCESIVTGFQNCK